MLKCLSWVRDFSFWAVTVKLVIAMILSGIMGLERGLKKRPAGFRTYILVCVGAALVMVTNQYMFSTFGTGDPARLGAQVISGIGFLGAGTIIVTGRNQVKGLTTAAGLWAAACLGLAIGIGFVEAAVIGFVLMYASLSILHRLDNMIIAKSKVIDLFAEFDSIHYVGGFISRLREMNIRVTSIEITKNKIEKDGVVSAVMTIVLQDRQPHSEILSLISTCEGVRY
ncbi:MAG: MgtC/SapB family protein, partial [Clostridiales bacterium]|nr:MgtC/SapB family protein [Clostridiales bacterium]